MEEASPCSAVLHPLATLKPGACANELSGPGCSEEMRCQCVLLNDSIYVLASDEFWYRGEFLSETESDVSLWRASVADLTSWTPLTDYLPKIRCCVLSTYESRLVLVGGCSLFEEEALNDVWVSLDGTSWEQSLPPMPTARYGVAAANTGRHPEHLIVAGGIPKSDKVEVLVERKWSSLSPLPEPYDCTSMTILNGNVHVFQSFCLDDSDYTPLFCRLDSLLATRHQTGAHVQWNKFDIPSQMCYSLVLVALTSYQGTLFAFGGYEDCQVCVLAFSPATQSWVRVQENLFTDPEPLSQVLPLPNRKLFLLSSCRDGDLKLFEAELKVSPYDPESEFSYGALDRLEAARVPILTSLGRMFEQLKDAIGVTPGYTISMDTAIEEWIEGNGSRPATWSSLYDVLKELDQEELIQEIEAYFHGPPSLKQQCTSVIMSALLQQWSLAPDQLPTRLPDYVPTTVKQSLTRTFKAYIWQPPSPTPSPPPCKKMNCDLEL